MNPLYMLSLEWKKIKNYRTFQVLILLYATLLPSLLLLGKQLNGLPPEIGSSEMFYMFPTVWNFLAYLGSWLSFFFLGFLVIILTTNEYTFKTLRQNVITGLTRMDFFKGKFMLILTIALFATLYYCVCSLAYGFTHTQAIYSSKIFQEIQLVPRYFLMCMGYMSFAFLVSILVKRTGLSVLLYIAYIMFLESALKGLLLYYTRSEVINFLPMNALEDLTPIPIGVETSGFTEEFGFSLILDPTTAMITSIVYITLILFGAYTLIKKADI